MTGECRRFGSMEKFTKHRVQLMAMDHDPGKTPLGLSVFCGWGGLLVFGLRGRKLFRPTGFFVTGLPFVRTLENVKRRSSRGEKN
ncbi:MAG: hypothetical protein Ct9H300mP23_11930 [Nitrospinota bacterium]|nr:MAG: hypothetical protein Ct9H300mP23_11930 [Nitrospinota bacterium]